MISNKDTKELLSLLKKWKDSSPGDPLDIVKDLRIKGFEDDAIREHLCNLGFSMTKGTDNIQWNVSTQIVPDFNPNVVSAFLILLGYPSDAASFENTKAEAVAYLKRLTQKIEEMSLREIPGMLSDDISEIPKEDRESYKHYVSSAEDRRKKKPGSVSPV